jgi:hypothetical protein
MDGPQGARLVRAALRCYPARWRRRHGEEAAELAALLIRDGIPAGSVALSYLAGAAREWLTPRPGRPLTAIACALLVAACSLGVSAGLLASAAPARAAGTSQAPGRAQCRPSLPRPFPGAVPARDRVPVVTWGAGHGRPC